MVEIKDKDYKKKYKKHKKAYKKRIPKGATYYDVANNTINNISKYGWKLMKWKLGLNTESKFLDTVDGATACTGTLVATTFACTIAQGDNSATRDGSDIRLTSYYIRGLFRSHASSATNRLVRFIMTYQPKIPTAGTNIVSADILENNTNVHSPYNMNTTGYTVIFDKLYNISANGNDNSMVPFTYAWNPMACHLKWTNANTTGASNALQEGYIRLWIMADSATNPPDFYCYTRVKFVDN